MKIKTKTGKIIDLSKCREELNNIDILYSVEHDVSAQEAKYMVWGEEYGEFLLDTLEAALNTPDEDVSPGYEAEPDYFGVILGGTVILGIISLVVFFLSLVIHILFGVPW